MRTAPIAALFWLAALAGCSRPEAPEPLRTGEFVSGFAGRRPAPPKRDSHVKYDLDPSAENFFVHVPENYVDDRTYGLIVFTASEDRFTELPRGWGEILDSRKYLFIAPQAAGNGQDRERRLGLAVLAALEMLKHYKIDPYRVYASGFSGGSRIAGLLGFYQSDLFRGTIQNSGADFFRPVATMSAKSWVDIAGKPYGMFDATDREVEGARSVRFALITGTDDFRRGNILDIYNGGFAQEGFQARLFEVPEMPHELCGGQTLSAVLDFLESPS